MPRLLSAELMEGSGEGGGVSEGLFGAPLKVMSISTNSRSCGKEIRSSLNIKYINFNLIKKRQVLI